ncbi:MAG TPA: hypothetical protein DDY20_02895 [Desulfobulbaceae bacterium]|nr:hypothetical protein [Desulfobulbaceae bacterium]
MTVDRLRRSLVLLALFFLAACGPGDSPEEQVRQYVAAAEAAVEARNLGGLKELITEQYQDEQGRTRRDIVAIAARYLYANKNIHVLTRIEGLAVSAPGQARLTVYAALTGQNVSDLDALLNMQADLYRFDLELVRMDGEWQLLRAEWRPARGEDFF